MPPTPPVPANRSHSAWVRSTHWIVTVSFVLLVISGVEILMVHPRLYWGNAGNDLMPAWLELPISKNYRHGGWEQKEAFYDQPGSPISEARIFRTFNRNSWGRSLHFLGAWLLVLTGMVYLLAGLLSGHFRRVSAGTGEPGYGVLQKSTYAVVVFLVLPLTAVTGFTMSPAITAAHPWLLTLCGGYQSARSVHFLLAVFLVLFLAAHVTMVARTGLGRNLRGMTLGFRHE